MVYAVGQAFDGGAEAALLARGDLEFGVLDGVGINRDTKSTCHRPSTMPEKRMPLI